MKLTALILGFLMITIVFLMGCSKEMSNEELYLKIIDANSNLNSYSADLNMGMNISIYTSERKMNMYSVMETSGYINRVNKQGYMMGKMDSRISSPDFDEETDNINMEIDMETYMLDNYIYTNTMGMWIKMKMDSDIWLKQDAAKSNIELLKNSSIEILDEESFNGESYYVIKLEPDIDALVSALGHQEALGLSDKEIQSKLRDIIKEYNIKMWINKKTLIIEKSETSVKMLFSPEPEENNGTEEQESVEMYYVAKVEIYNINKDLAVTLPEEAGKATDLSSLYDYINQDSEEAKEGSSITGNVIAEALRS